MTPLVLAAVALAGGLGAVVRFVIDGLVKSRIRSPFPLGTMLINVSGSLLLGFVTGLALAHLVSHEWQLVLGTGFLGGYTTFSTASFETLRLLQTRRVTLALLNGLGMLVLAVLAAAAGLALASLLP